MNCIPSLPSLPSFDFLKAMWPFLLCPLSAKGATPLWPQLMGFDLLSATSKDHVCNHLLGIYRDHDHSVWDELLVNG